MKIIDTYSLMNKYLFNKDFFTLDDWDKYANSIGDGFLNTINGDVDSNSNFKELWKLLNNNSKRLLSVSSCFKIACEKIKRRRKGSIYDVDANICLYVGKGNGAGWATFINNRPWVLIGIEKVIELNWDTDEKMYALIAHELGHIWHFTKGNVATINNECDKYLWQLFSEGIAMYYEQTIMGDKNYFHQNDTKWIKYCSNNIYSLNQRYFDSLINNPAACKNYFGDYNQVDGYSDIGYFLGARFIYYLCQKIDIIDVIKLNLLDIFDKYQKYLDSLK